ncbi:hypothetical protein [Lysobacter sp. TY2-98]|uniref:hypothetical protein n=1 Tax=Lysobacter sp. TY2-98 TaxID=2290922 RepID=UPI001F0859AC|nr:hypothetical protein [Lysobacter sp. TY2-98]
MNAKLRHEARTVGLHCSLAHSQVVRDLLVESSGHDSLEHRPLARCQRRRTIERSRYLGRAVALFEIATHGRFDRGQQNASGGRLGKHIDRASAHRLHRSGDVVGRRKEHEWGRARVVRKRLLQVKAARAREAHFNDQALRYLRSRRGQQEVTHRWIQPHFKPAVREQPRERDAHGLIGVDDVHDTRRAGARVRNVVD